MKPSPEQYHALQADLLARDSIEHLSNDLTGFQVEAAPAAAGLISQRMQRTRAMINAQLHNLPLFRSLEISK